MVLGFSVLNCRQLKTRLSLTVAKEIMDLRFDSNNLIVFKNNQFAIHPFLEGYEVLINFVHTP